MKKVYFISDFHLGIDTEVPSHLREKYVVHFLDSIKHEASEIYLLGDILDFWFEYKSVVPKGFTRLFGKLAELTDMGISIEWYTGNHDMWTFGYLESELGVVISKNPLLKKINGKTCFLCHGDGLGKGDSGYKIIKTVISNPISRFLFSLVPSGIGIWIMKNFSKGSRHGQSENLKKEYAKAQRLIDYFEDQLRLNQIDYFIHGHLHDAEIKNLSNGTSKAINLGDWTSKWTYAVMETTGEIKLKKYTIPS